MFVVIPLVHRTTWEELKGFAKAVALAIARAEPKRYIATANRAKREGKLFIDHLRNSRGATSVAAYSTRARYGAPVSTPLRRDELESVASTDAYTVANLLQRFDALAEDPWTDFFKVKQYITSKMGKALCAE